MNYVENRPYIVNYTWQGTGYSVGNIGQYVGAQLYQNVVKEAQMANTPSGAKYNSK